MNTDRIENSEARSAERHRSPRRLWVRWLLSLVIFVSGAFVGTGITVMVIRNGVLRRIHHPEEMPRLMAARLRWPLGLSDAQVAEIEEILQRRQASLQRIRGRFQPEFEAELDVIDGEIAGVLDEQQTQRWEEFFRRIRSRWIPPLPDDAPGEAVTP